MFSTRGAAAAAKEIDAVRQETSYAFQKINNWRRDVDRLNVEMQVFSTDTKEALRHFQAFKQEADADLNRTQKDMEQLKKEVDKLKQGREIARDLVGSAVREFVATQLQEMRHTLETQMKQQLDARLREVGQHVDARVQEVKNEANFRLEGVDMRMEARLAEQDRLIKELLKVAPAIEERLVEHDKLIRELLNSAPLKQQVQAQGQAQPTPVRQPDRQQVPAARGSDDNVSEDSETIPVPDVFNVSGPNSCRSCHGTYLHVRGKAMFGQPYWKRIKEGVEWFLYRSEEKCWMVSKSKDGQFVADYLRSEQRDIPFITPSVRWLLWDKAGKRWQFDSSVSVVPEQLAPAKGRKTISEEDFNRKNDTLSPARIRRIGKHGTPEMTMLEDLPDSDSDEIGGGHRRKPAKSSKRMLSGQ